MPINRITPVIKWAGGKTQLLEQIITKMPSTYNHYYEPFIGGGAVFLAVKPRKAFINDINAQLVNLYHQLKQAPKDIIAEVKKLDNIRCDKDFYYTIRNKYNEKIVKQELDVECASLMIWLNKHCFNGLYRVNKKGLFNVPYNNRVTGSSLDESNILALAHYLKFADIEITCGDFTQVCESVKEDDFVYFDSPYIPESDTANFTDYSKTGFSLDDHKRLAILFKTLDTKGAKLMLSNNDVPLVHELYTGYKIQKLNVKRMINRNAGKRSGKEVLITNY